MSAANENQLWPGSYRLGLAALERPPLVTIPRAAGRRPCPPICAAAENGSRKRAREAICLSRPSAINGSMDVQQGGLSKCWIRGTFGCDIFCWSYWLQS